MPYATLEPIRKMLLQQFMGEKFGRDNIWEGHLASELWATKLEVRAVSTIDQVLELALTDVPKPLPAVAIEAKKPAEGEAASATTTH